MLIYTKKKRNEIFPAPFSLLDKIIASLFSIHLHNRSNCFNANRTYCLTRQSFGASCTKMLFVFFHSLNRFFRRLCCNQITFIGKNRTIKFSAGMIVWAYFKTKSAFQTFCNGIPVIVILVATYRTAFYICFCIVQIFINNAAIHHKICQYREFTQRFKHQICFCYFINKCVACKSRHTVDYHSTTATNSLQTTAMCAITSKKNTGGTMA